MHIAQKNEQNCKKKKYTYKKKSLFLVDNQTTWQSELLPPKRKEQKLAKALVFKNNILYSATTVPLQHRGSTI